MDADDSLLEHKSFFDGSDEDLDFALSLSLQTHADAEVTEYDPKAIIPHNDKSALSKSDEDMDAVLALSLQTQFDKEIIEGDPDIDLHQNAESFLRKMDDDLDFALALFQSDEFYANEINKNLVLKSSESCTSKDGAKPLSIVDEQWELIDPLPDIRGLFLEYDAKFFYGKLKGVEVKWSPRMTLCAGVCSYEGRGGLCSIRLSVPLLKLRPRRDLVETLLHEMIHAYLFVTHNYKDRNDHGPEFLSHMNRINKETGTKISVYHSFHDEVDVYRTHWWQCDGPCQKRRPFFGLVKRAMNRVPGPRDNWWAQHQATCGGIFHKIREPETSKRKAVKRKPTLSEAENKKGPDIRNFFSEDSVANGTAALDSGGKNRKHSQQEQSNIHVIKTFSMEDNLVNVNNGICTNPSQLPAVLPLPKKSFVPFSGNGYKLGSSVHKNTAICSSSKTNQGLSRLSFTERTVSKYETSNTQRKPKISNSQSKDVASTRKGSSMNNKYVQSSLDNFIGVSPPRVSANDKSILNFNHKSCLISEEEKNTINNFSKVECPVCYNVVKNDEINRHLDMCLLPNG